MKPVAGAEEGAEVDPDEVDLEGGGVGEEEGKEGEEGEEGEDEIEEDPDKRNRLDGYYVAMGILLVLCILGTVSYMAGQVQSAFLSEKFLFAGRIQHFHSGTFSRDNVNTTEMSKCKNLPSKFNAGFSFPVTNLSYKKPEELWTTEGEKAHAHQHAHTHLQRIQEAVEP